MSIHVNLPYSTSFRVIPCHAFSFHLNAFHLICVCIFVLVVAFVCFIWTKWSDAYPLCKTAVKWQQFGKAYTFCYTPYPQSSTSKYWYTNHPQKYYKLVDSGNCLVCIAEVVCKSTCVWHVDSEQVPFRVHVAGYLNVHQVPFGVLQFCTNYSQISKFQLKVQLKSSK